MNQFFSDIGAAANVTGPTAYQGQSAGYYTGGGAWVRYPQKTVNPINLQLPSVRAGCGGIDIFGGSFSMINAAEFVALLKAIANNAVGFAFKLAIESISPEISKIMDELQDKVQQMNQMSISSCEAAQNLVGSLWPKTDTTSRYICATIGRNTGLFADAARERQGCGNEDRTADTVAGNTDPNLAKLPGMPQNFTWAALKESHPSLDREFREFLMTLVGTTIVDTSTKLNGSSAPTYRPIPAAGAPFISALLDGNNFNAEVLRCDEDTKCLHPTRVQLSMPQSQSLKARVGALVNSMIAKSRQPDATLTVNEIGLLGSTSIPLYKIITVHSAAQFGGLNGSERENLIEVVAIDFLNTMVQRFMEIPTKAAGSFQGADAESIHAWAEQMRESAKAFDQLEARARARFDNAMTIVNRTVWMEKTLRQQMSPQLYGSVQWSQGMGQSLR